MEVASVVDAVLSVVQVVLFCTGAVAFCFGGLCWLLWLLYARLEPHLDRMEEDLARAAEARADRHSEP